LRLLGGFLLTRGSRAISLPLATQRVLAFLALSRRSQLRVYVAGSLWIDSSQDVANGGLRTALWRLGGQRRELIESTSTHVGLCEDVSVDLGEASRRARRLLAGDAVSIDDVTLLGGAGDLLPDWYDEWVLMERERFRQLRLHTLELLCRELTRRGRFAEAADAGMAALSGEPLRESAHRALIEMHLAEGNRSEALRQFRFCRRLLRESLGVEPTESMAALVGPAPGGVDGRSHAHVTPAV
jgi:DNA-binding SARP family transcriptional activator